MKKKKQKSSKKKERPFKKQNPFKKMAADLSEKCEITRLCLSLFVCYPCITLPVSRFTTIADAPFGVPTNQIESRYSPITRRKRRYFCYELINSMLDSNEQPFLSG